MEAFFLKSTLELMIFLKIYLNFQRFRKLYSWHTLEPESSSEPLTFVKAEYHFFFLRV